MDYSEHRKLFFRKYINDNILIHQRKEVKQRTVPCSIWLMEKFYSNLSIKGKPLLTRMAAELFGTNQGFPIEKARRELGYKPNVDFYEGMDNVKIWLHQIGLT